MDTEQGMIFGDASENQMSFGIYDRKGLRVVSAKFNSEKKFDWGVFNGFDTLRVLTYSVSVDAIVRMLDKYAFTTFGQEYLPNEADCPIFVNADLIAAGLSPFRPADAAIRAGRLMLEEIDNHARADRTFAIETTLSGQGYVRRIRQWRADGYTVKLIFLSLATPEEAITRVKSRVNQGGHDVPEAVIRRRFNAGLRNFQDIYRHCVDDWFGYNNGGMMPIKKELPKPHSYEEGVTAALIRAAKRAHLIAHQTGTKVVVMRDGKVVEIDPDPEMYNDI